jgi:uncharacterized protein YceH (UPF0502 family)
MILKEQLAKIQQERPKFVALSDVLKNIPDVELKELMLTAVDEAWSEMRQMYEAEVEKLEDKVSSLRDRIDALEGRLDY